MYSVTYLGICIPGGMKQDGFAGEAGAVEGLLPTHHLGQERPRWQGSGYCRFQVVA